MFKFYSILLFISLFVSQCFPGLPERLTCADLSVEQRAESDLCCNLGESRICDNGASGCFTQSCNEDLSWSVDDCEDPIPEAAILSDNQEGVCLFSQKLCLEGQLIEPNYSDINLFEEVEMTCDREDNDCDGQIDEGCDPDCGPELCNDGVDNDCDSQIDETATCSEVSWDAERVFSGYVNPRTINLPYPRAVTADSQNNIYVASEHRVYKVNDTAISVFAGREGSGYSGDGGLAIHATLDHPRSLSIDSEDNLLIADYNNHRIRKVDSKTGIITTIVGNGEEGYSGDGGPAIEAQLNQPSSVFVDAHDNIWVAEIGNHTVRKVSFEDGIITTIAGTGMEGPDRRDGENPTDVNLYYPDSVFVNADGDVWIADRGTDSIRKINAEPHPVTREKVLNRVAGNFDDGLVLENVRAIETTLNNPVSIFVDENEDLWIADNYSHRIRKVVNGIINTVVGRSEIGFSGSYSGDNGPAIQSELNRPQSIFITQNNTLLIADSDNNRIRQVDLETEIITTRVGDGNTYFTEDGYIATQSKFFISSIGLDSSGDLLIAGNHRIRKVDTRSGLVTTIVGNGVNSHLGDGGPAIEASLSSPNDIYIDEEDHIWISNLSNSNIFDSRVRRVDSDTGFITTVAGGGDEFVEDNNDQVATDIQFVNIQSIFLDPRNNLWIADTGLHQIFKVNSNGVIERFCGTGAEGIGGDNGPAIDANLSRPGGLFLDRNENLFFGDIDNHRVRKVDGKGIIRTVAGTGINGYLGDGGPADQARLYRPQSIFVDDQQDIWIADSNNGVIRKVDFETGHIETAIGSYGFVENYSGDGGLATEAQFSYGINKIIVDDLGDIWIADNRYNQVRKVDHNTGIITTVAGEIDPIGVGSFENSWIDYPINFTPGPLNQFFLISGGAEGRLYQVDFEQNKIDVRAGYPRGFNDGQFSEELLLERDWDPNESPARYSRLFKNAFDIVYDFSRNVIYISEQAGNTIRRINLYEAEPETWSIETIAGSDIESGAIDGNFLNSRFSSPSGLALDTVRNFLYVSDKDNSRIRILDLERNNVLSLIVNSEDNLELISPEYLIYNGENQLFVSDSSQNRIFKLILEDNGLRANLTTFIGNGQDDFGEIQDGSLALGISLPFIRGLAFRSNGDLFISSYNRIIHVIAQDGEIDIDDPVKIIYQASDNNPIPVDDNSIARETIQLMGGLYWSEEESSLYALEIMRGHLLRLTLQQP